MTQPDKPSSSSSSFSRFFSFSSYAPLATDENASPSSPLQVKPNIGQILRSKRVRFVAAASAIAFVVLFFIYHPNPSLNLDDYIRNPFAKGPAISPDKPSTPVPELPKGGADAEIDWSRFAYTQYATNSDYLCNSVMLFEILHRLGSKADRLLMYPSSMKADPNSDNTDSKLLIKAQKEYGVKLSPIEVLHRDGGDPTWADSYTKLLAFNQTQYDRVLSLDSDSTVLQSMDELFLMPSAHVAMPRAYWLEKESTLSSQLVLIQPTDLEFARIMKAVETAKGGHFDMEIVNDLYGKDCMIIPHRRYDLLTGEFRKPSTTDHTPYLGNDYELWDPEKMLAEAKFLHFSDWPMPKPWMPVSQSIVTEVQPPCVRDSVGKEDCKSRDIWLGFYSDFRERRKNVCSVDTPKVKARSEGGEIQEIRPRGRYEYVLEA